MAQNGADSPAEEAAQRDHVLGEVLVQQRSLQQGGAEVGSWGELLLESPTPVAWLTPLVTSFRGPSPRAMGLSRRARGP